MQKFENKYDLLNRAYQDEQLKKGSIALLQYLVHKSDRTHCFPAVDTIAAALGCCRRTVQYNMRKLEKAGYIIRKDRWYNHQQLSNQYCFAVGITEEKRNIRISDESTACKEMTSSFEKTDVDMDKARRIKEIYTTDLSAGEKLLLTNFCFRANQKGIVYGTVSSLKKGLGMRGLRPGCIRDNFYQWLLQLRVKGLIDIKTVYINRKKYLIIHIRNVNWNKPNGNVQSENHRIEIQEGDNREEAKSGNQKKRCRTVDTDEAKHIRRARNVQQVIQKMIHRVWNGLRKILQI